MTAPINKPISQEQLERFKAYHQANGGWKNLHLVLDNQNVKDQDVRQCIESAIKDCDAEGHLLANILTGMSKSQRLKLSRQVL